jgi:hypothetical protein
MKKLAKLKPMVQIDLKYLDMWELELVSVTDWVDYESKQVIGKKYYLAVAKDNIVMDGYPKNTNKYEKFYVKVKGTPTHVVNPDDIVKIVGITKLVTYGDYGNDISCEAKAVVTMDDYRALQARQHKG